MSRLIRADLLKLRRRTGMLAVVALFVFGSIAAYFGAGLFLESNGDFDTATGVLTLIASVVGAIVGATAGGADIESACSATSWPPAARAPRCSSPACPPRGSSRSGCSRSP